MSTCVVTCGPASTRIDEVRRITNFSTGELGTLLAEALAADGHEVICLRGEGATFRPPGGTRIESFFSNDDMLKLLREISASKVVTHLFHAAALTDFEVVAPAKEKISSSTPELNLRLRPALKIISQLRGLFSETAITGWKYELTGTKEDGLQKAQKQMKTNRTDACVLNGAAHGPGFTWLNREIQNYFPDKLALAHFLVQKVKAHVTD